MAAILVRLADSCSLPDHRRRRRSSVAPPEPPCPMLQVAITHMPPWQPVPSWGELARQHWPHYCAVLLLVLGLAASDRIPPQQHALYSASDRQWWAYTRPTLQEALPDVGMPLLAVGLPLAVVWLLAGSRLEAHHMGLALLACVAASGLATNLLKTQVCMEFLCKLCAMRSVGYGSS